MGTDRLYYNYVGTEPQERYAGEQKDTKLTDIYDHDTVMHTFSTICISLILMHYLSGSAASKKWIKNVLGRLHPLKVPSHQIRLCLKCYGWIGLDEYKDRGW